MEGEESTTPSYGWSRERWGHNTCYSWCCGGSTSQRVYPRRWIRRSISKIIRCMSRRIIRRIILRSLNLTSISLMRISSISMTIIMSSMMILSSLRAAEGGVRGRTRQLWRGAFCRGWCTCGMQDMGRYRCKYILMFILLLLLFIQLIVIIILLI